MVADIGTDHAYLPVWAVLEGVAKSAVASDIREGPAERAQATIAKYNVQDFVKVIVAPGLDGINLDDVDDVVIAGMGGETIISILEAAEPVKYLILQPQTNLPLVRQYLAAHGYAFTERIVFEGEKIYHILKADYTGRPYELSQYDVKIGRPDGDVARYEEKLKNRANKQIDGLKMAANINEEAMLDAAKMIELLGGQNDDNK